MREVHFEQGPIRPPSEAYGLLLWVTRNCPWNRCEFCHTYKDEKFSLRTVEEVKRDIDMVQEVVSEVKALSWKYGFGGEITAPLGRRMGIYHSIEDLSKPELRNQVERVLQQIEGERPGGVEKVLSELAESFI